jgi:sec-independent protein translocase protein TatA
MFGLGIYELLVILIIVVLLFGSTRLPTLGSGLGKAIRGFKDSLTGKDAIDVTPKNEKGEEKRSREGKA